MASMLDEIEKGLKEKLKRQPMSSRALLDRLRLLDDSSRRTSQYQDPNYLPFYYYLSKVVFPKSVFNVGLDLGLPLCCFLTGCSSAERVLAFQKLDKSFYSPRIAVSNLKDVRPSGLLLDYYRGNIIDESLESKMSSGFDLVLVSSKMGGDEINDVLDVCWKSMNLDAVMVVDHLQEGSKSIGVFRSFCKVRNRSFAFFETRYGTAVVRK